MYYSALIGKSTDYSVSHILFEELIKLVDEKIEYKHLKINVNSDELSEVLNAFDVLNFSGINITHPYKVEVMQFVEKISNTAKIVGAVNTIKFGDNMVGYNTDWKGIINPIKSLFPHNKIDTVTIFGSGGAARSAVFASKKLGAKKIYVLSRKNGDLKDLKGISVKAYEDVRLLVSSSNLIINATSTGMINNDESPFKISELDGLDLTDKLYFDVVFKPLNTVLLKYFAKNGAQTVDGLWMMIYQAIAALNIWLDQIKIDASQDELKIIYTKLARKLTNES